MRRVRGLRGAIGLVVFFIALAAVPGALAHEDVNAWTGAWTLGPGDTVAVERPVHWHRMYGEWQADAPVTLLVDGEPVDEPAESGQVHHLLACCGTTWTDVTVAMQNPGDQDVTVVGEFFFVHDNLAVVVDDAEPGAWWQFLVILLLMIGIPAWQVRQPALPGDAAPWSKASRALHGAAWAGALVLVAYGMMRFGGGPMVASTGATAGHSAYVGPFLNVSAVLMLVLMALWGAAYACWAGARRRGAAGPHGIAFAAGILIVGFAIMAELGFTFASVVIWLVPLVAVVADQWGVFSRSGPDQA